MQHLCTPFIMTRHTTRNKTLQTRRRGIFTYGQNIYIEPVHVCSHIRIVEKLVANTCIVYINLNVNRDYVLLLTVCVLCLSLVAIWPTFQTCSCLDAFFHFDHN